MNLFNRIFFRLFLMATSLVFLTLKHALDAAQLSIPASCVALSSDAKLFFAGAAQSDAVAEHALSGGNREKNESLPLMTEKASINGVADQKNPLYNIPLDLVGLVEERNMFEQISSYKPVVVTARECATVYTVEQYGVVENKQNEQPETQKKSAEAQNKEEKKQEQTRLCVARDVKDSTSAVTGGIVALSTLIKPTRIFMAVKSHTGVWGERGSGIALVEPRTQEVALTAEEKQALADAKKKQGSEQQEPEQQTKNVQILSQIDLWFQKPVNDAVCRAIPLDISCDAVKIGGDLTSLGDAVAMHWDPLLNRLYIALQPTAGAAVGDGARSIVVGRLESIIEIDQEALKKKEAARKASPSQEADSEVPKKARLVLHLEPIMPIAACGDSAESIIGVRRAGARICQHAVRTMGTSTSLNYLIVQGGVGAPHETKRSVYAVPLVRSSYEIAKTNGTLEKLRAELVEKTKTEDKAACAALQEKIEALMRVRYAAELRQGTIACQHEDPRTTDAFGQTAPYRFADRSFKTPATSVSDVCCAHDAAACVGGGALVAGDITSLTVRGDSVLVTVADAVPGQQPGVFYSQALFDQTGKIKNWTLWRRAGVWMTAEGEHGKIFGLAIDGFDQKMALIGDSSKKITAIKRSQWSQGEKDGHGLVHALNAVLEKEQTGVLGLFDFPAGIPGLADASLFAALGSRCVALAHTSSVIDSVLVPYTGSFVADMCFCSEGSVPSVCDVSGLPTNAIPVQTRLLCLSGGDLEQISPLTSLEIIPYKNTGVVCAAGVGGIAVLVDAQGLGWNQFTHFSQLPATLHWKKISSLPFVTKLMCDDCFLYVLSDASLLRIDLHQIDFSADSVAQQTDAVIEIAVVTSMPGLHARSIFTDCVISGKFAALGTSKGLMRLGNGKDVRMVSSSRDAQWTLVDLPESLGVVNRLVPISVTGRAQDVARCGGGMLYALDVNLGKNKGHLVRFTVADLEKTELDSSCLQLLPDYFFKDRPAPCLDFESYKDQFITDGSLHLVMRNRDGEDVSSIQAATPSFRAGSRGLGKTMLALPIEVSKAHTVSSAVRCSTTGAWLVGGDMGVYINE